jgi:hypothetical protein
MFRLRQRKPIGEPTVAYSATHTYHSALSVTTLLQEAAVLGRDSFSNNDGDEDVDDVDDVPTDEESDTRLWVLVADTQEEYEYWKEGLALYCARAPSDRQQKKAVTAGERHSLGSSFAEASLSNSRLEQLQTQPLAEYTESPPPLLVCILQWLRVWLEEHAECGANIESVLFGEGGVVAARRDVAVGTVVSELCDSGSISKNTAVSHVGGALLYMLSRFPVPVVPEHQLAQLLSAMDVSDAGARGAAMHAVLCKNVLDSFCVF